MAKKLERLLEAYQSNVYPAMLDDLAGHLGVTKDSLLNLDLGWAPIVPFKKGDNFDGWWVIPERDHAGVITGLSLRSQKDFKVMYPGSKHGLTYAVNPDHEAGQEAYRPGPQNWIRTMDAEVDCPVCGKPDGCLVHSENPDDPQAAVCIRTKSERKLRFGYVHILKEQGNLTGGSPLLDSDLPVVVTEGMTDAAAAMDMGFVAVGRPSNLAGMETLKTLLRGRKVIVVGENDRKPDGTEPGREGMIAAFQVLRSVCKDLKMIMPPEHVKDLRQWKNTDNITAEEFLTFADAAGQQNHNEVVIEDDRPRTIADRFLRDTYRMAGRWSIRYWRGTWFEFQVCRYREIDAEIIRHKLYEWAHDKYVMVTRPNGEQGLERVDATRHWVTNVEDAMRSITVAYNEDCPTWLDGREDNTEYIVFQNGLMNLDKYLAGEDFSSYMQAPNPDYFNMLALPFSFDPDAVAPKWKSFTFSSLGDETGKSRLLQEYLGYILSGSNRHQCFLMMRGVPASGKGTISNAVMSLVGRDQATETKLSTLGDTYGLENLFGTMVATITEMKMPRSSVAEQSFETLLQITGGDTVSINRKYLPILKAVKLKTRFLISCNELPSFSDHSGALKRRMMVLEFARSFSDKKDLGLQAALEQELPGICVWALEGLRRLNKQGHFTEPGSSKRALNNWVEESNPVSAFVDECIVFKDKECLSDINAYNAFKAYCDERGRTPLSLSRFRGLFVDATPSTVYRNRRNEDGTGRTVVTLENCTFAPWVRKHYT